MTADSERAPQGGSPAANPLEALHLLPAAPYELVTEVYWHLVEAARADAGAVKMRELNRAYAWATGAKGPQQDDQFPDGSERPAGRRGLLRRRARTPARARPDDPWALLRLLPGAPPAVIEIAHEFWGVRLRNSGAPAAAFSKLKDAYRELRGEPSGVDTREQPAMRQVQGIDTRPPVEEVATVSAPPATGTAAAEPAGPRAGERLAAGARTLGHASKEEGRKLFVALRKWAADPFGEVRSGAAAKPPPVHDPAEVVPTAAIEERFAALAANRNAGAPERDGEAPAAPRQEA